MILVGSPVVACLCCLMRPAPICPAQKSYWCGNSSAGLDDHPEEALDYADVEGINEEFFEPAPEGITPGIKIRNLRKVPSPRPCIKQQNSVPNVQYLQDFGRTRHSWSIPMSSHKFKFNMLNLSMLLQTLSHITWTTWSIVHFPSQPPKYEEFPL